MSEDEKKRVLEGLEYHFEYLVEHFLSNRHGARIKLRESPDMDYLVSQLVEATGAPEEKVVEGIENWMSGIWRKYG